MVTKCRHKVTKEVVAIKKFKDNDDDEQVRWLCWNQPYGPCDKSLHGALSNSLWQQWQALLELPACTRCNTHA